MIMQVIYRLVVLRGCVNLGCDALSGGLLAYWAKLTGNRVVYTGDSP